MPPVPEEASEGTPRTDQLMLGTLLLKLLLVVSGLIIGAVAALFIGLAVGWIKFTC
ncbi:hypothetical protein IGB42_00428 [Andreprevotia sp. IGB-42]|nr:hypothetical protein IGB42_00428 [Andreprevotia sp. IGB-42]